MIMGVPSINFRITLLVLTLLIIFLSQNRTEAVPTFINSACPNISTFNVNTPNNTYQSNRNNLLLYLSSNATGNTEYYNATASTVSSVEDTVYGLFVCRGDMSADDCRDCVADATKVIVNLCPVQKAAIAWSGAKKFKTKEATFTALQTLYTLAQCTPDLSGADCNSCLKIATNTLPGCCGGKQEGTVLLPSCVIKYAVSPFYTVNTSVPTPTEALVPGSAITPKGKTRISTQTIVVIVASISVSAVLFVTGYCFLSRRQRKNYNVIQEENESLQFDFATIEAATDKFSDHNKLGEGGFGVVYKGLLPNKQEIAVKRLSKNSEQGLGEFKNEVVTVAKLQHRNLVRLLGFCLEGEEKILVYEYVANKSLDYFLYDPIRREKFDWSSRYKIIRGIARGILYLHEDSRLRIIHRDLKASNILLDQDMNPKISDFGMAKIFGVDETQGNTNRIVGTLLGSIGEMKHPWNCWIQLWETLTREMKSSEVSILDCTVYKTIQLTGLPWLQ
uniref:Uncharacterized protein n=1 Tax=Fagus sylvatica TaxID=28930 RepID=A0A2N9HSR1_FAGSY